MFSGLIWYIIELMSYLFQKNQLIDLYWKRKLSTYSISDKVGCDPKTVYRYLKLYNIPTRPRKRVSIPKTELLRLYRKGVSMRGIGNRYGICATAVHRKVHAAGIVARCSWDANTVHPTKDFIENQREKAYLIGFRVGDLHVMVRSPQSSIIVKSGTTKYEQLKLMKQLFKGHGPIHICGPHQNLAYQFQVRLNRSFDFLITKHKDIPRWICEDDKYLWEFVAGYVDAEGSFGVYADRGKFRLGSYDKKILDEINNFFLKDDIHTFYELEREAGYVSKSGTRCNGNFWRITINHAPSLLKLHTGLSRRLRHIKRIKDMQNVYANVRRRGY